MSIVEDRKKALENKFVLDQELKFKVEGRRNKMLGIWAAELMGKADREAYGLEVIDASLKPPGEDGVFAKVRGDFDAAGVTKTDEEVRAKMNELLVEAATFLSAN